MYGISNQGTGNQKESIDNLIPTGVSRYIDIRESGVPGSMLTTCTVVMFFKDGQSEDHWLDLHHTIICKSYLKGYDVLDMDVSIVTIGGEKSKLDDWKLHIV